ncbi:MAG: hypothetical protein V5786_04410 [Psychromonas sp.]
MEERIQHFKISLYAEMIFGIILSIVLPVFIVRISETSLLNSLFGAFLGFCLVALPLILLPIMSIRELNEFPEKNSLFLNYMNTGVVIAFVFFPLALWQIFMFRKLKPKIVKK